MRQLAKVLSIDIETQRGIVEVFDLWPKYIDMKQVRVPTRILCFAAKWRDEEEVQFYSAFKERRDYNVDAKQYRAMLQAAWDLLTEADVVVTYNGNKFDLGWFKGEFGRLELGPPAPYRSLDLYAVAKKHFAPANMSMKLDWFSRRWLGDKKVGHGDLWSAIRYGTRDEQLAAQQLMMDYNIHDVVLTERLFDRFLPWTGMNFALFDQDNEDRLVCPYCESTRYHKRGFAPGLSYMYQRYKCLNPKCGGWFKGKKMIYTTELRPV